MSTLTFGIEEEFVLLDPSSLATVDVGAQAVAELRAAGAGVTHEFRASQVEYVSPVLTRAAEALAELTVFRRHLYDWSRAHGVLACGAGTPYDIGAGSRVHADARYERIADDIAGLADEHQINGLHVHVARTDRDDGVDASNALRPWLPLLLALSADSPFWRGRDTGFASWRALHGRRWTTHGIPPLFADAADLDRTVSAHGGLGATSDAGTVNWNVRVSATHSTVEVRVCDAQLSADDAVPLAALIRALVDGRTRDVRPVEPAAGVWDAALWHAARHGLSGTLLDPVSATVGPARHAVRSLLAAAGPALTAHGDLDLVEGFLGRILRFGTGARRQWDARRHGVPALAQLYRDAMAHPQHEARRTASARVP
ncbi:carboxylate-amine ligase [Microbacterium telephonicum]|uniref:Putative glutamate--cysteine ligase 2 n=1 Tax=Microbacterium telephonicum TaxID=1714841 RepID=A0A498C1Q1_9MICO|nr:YbdK family carboxylate-amine ligase [Microbacterium telephonicum]RLK49049.1 carboxylate-amine ligase [Microbacterium telephonicum]